MKTIIDGNHLLSMDRRRKILEVINEKHSVSVDELAELFPVSTITIRRDLDKLAEEGAVNRVHGGAMALGGIVTSPRASTVSANLTDEQLRIGKEAARQIADGDFIIIESGSTCLALAQQLADKKRLKVVTASPRIAMTLADLTEKHNTDFEILLSGGTLHVYKNFCIGPHARTLFESVKVDVAFISVTAIDLAAGVTADNVYEAEISRIILEQCSKRRVGLVASQKFGKVSFVKVTDAEIFDEIITDTKLDPLTASRYAERGLRITMA